jgi:hypothetical protein
LELITGEARRMFFQTFLLEGLIAEAAKRGEVDLSLVSVDSCSCTLLWPSTACVLQ